MTREEAIRYLEQHKYQNTCGQKSLMESNEAIDMAIEALSTEHKHCWDCKHYEPKYNVCHAPEVVKQVTGKLKNHCDSLLKADSDECKEQKSKLDLISRADAIEAVTDIQDGSGQRYYLAVSLVDKIRSLPSAEAVHGEWIFNTDENNGKSWNICSNCGHSQFHATNYCPNCGAVMSVPIQPVEMKKPFTVDEIPQNYEQRILGNVEVVVRCRNCKHYRAGTGSCTAEHWDLSRATFPHVEPNDYCSYGANKK